MALDTLLYTHVHRNTILHTQRLVTLYQLCRGHALSVTHCTDHSTAFFSLPAHFIVFYGYKMDSFVFIWQEPLLGPHQVHLVGQPPKDSAGWQEELGLLLGVPVLVQLQ